MTSSSLYKCNADKIPNHFIGCVNIVFKFLKSRPTAIIAALCALIGWILRSFSLHLAPPPHHDPSTGLSRTLQQLRRDHTGVQNPNRRRFASIDEALHRLLPYHVFQGAPPSLDEFSQGVA